MAKQILKYYLSFAKLVNHYFWNDKVLYTRPWYLKYGFPLLLSAMITFIKVQFIDVLGINTPFLLSFGIVLLATGFGGFGPGLFAIVLTAFITRYYFMMPVRELKLDSSQTIQLIVYILECLLLIALSAAVTRVSSNLRRTAERFRIMIENSSDAIAVLNAEGKVLYASSATERVLGFTSKEFKKLNAWDQAHPDETEMLQKFYEQIIQAPGKSFCILHRYKTKQGDWAWIESTATNLLHDKDVHGIVSNFRNVTEKIILEKQKDDFVGIATHELKTPVTSVKAYAQILQKRFNKEGNLSASAMMGKMDAQLDKLIGLISELLDVTKIEGGRLQMNREEYYMNELVLDIVEELQRTTDDHRIIMNLDNDLMMLGDRERTGQVLSNLITNAIKYSPSAADVHVKTKLNGDSVTVSVEDHGVGISKENQERIFERFYRVTDANNNTFPGLGLGLYISHEIIEKQGGTINVQSENNKGSTFSFTLPKDYRAALKVIDTNK